MDFITDIKSFWNAAEITEFEPAVECLTGERPQSMLELRRRLLSLDRDSDSYRLLVEQIEDLLAWLEAYDDPVTGKVPAAKSEIAKALTGNCEAEADRLYRALHTELLCAALVLASKGRDSAILARFNRLARHIDLPNFEKLPETVYKDGESGHELALVREFFGVRDTGGGSGSMEVILSREAAEARDLLLTLIGEPLADAEHTVTMHILGDGGGQGFYALLDLERLKDGEGFIRHPDSLLLPSDSMFLAVFETVKEWAKAGFQLDGKPLTTWDKGAIRWRLRCPAAPQSSATGGSIGGAVGAGVALLLSGETSDKIAITAEIELENNELLLKPVLSGSIPNKVRAAENNGVLIVMVAPAQKTEFDRALQDAPVELFGMKTVRDAANEIKIRSGHWKTVTEAILRNTDSIELPHTAVAFEKVYVDLPMLEEIEVEDLPSAPMDRDGPEPRSRSDAEDKLRRWEEAFLRGKRTKYERRTLSELVSRNRFSIIGPPGSGKSTVIRWIARQTALGELKWQDRAVLPVIIGLQAWEKTGSATSLLGFLADGMHFTKAKTSWPGEKQWDTWIKQGDVLLMFDGLDEVSVKWAREQLKPALEQECKNCSAIVSCRTISKEMLSSCVPQNMQPQKGSVSNVVTPSPLDSSKQEEYVRNKYQVSEKNKKYWKPDDVLTQMNQISGIDLIAANPLLLSIVCYVADDSKGTQLPPTRAGLYDQAVDRLLGQMQQRVNEARLKQEDITLGDMHLVPIRNFLERLALDLLNREDLDGDAHREGAVRQPLKYDFNTTTRLFKGNRKQGHYAGYTFDTTEDEDLLSNTQLEIVLKRYSRLFIYEETSETNKNYSFLHRTFQEYLAACALVRWAEGPVAEDHKGLELGKFTGWTQAFRRIDAKFCRPEKGDAADQPQIELTSCEAFLAFIDQKSWLPTWSEVIKFMIGQLEDPAPVLEFLSDQHISRDDLFRHRLALAAECLAEIDPAKYRSEEDDGESAA